MRLINLLGLLTALTLTACTIVPGVRVDISGEQTPKSYELIMVGDYNPLVLRPSPLPNDSAPLSELQSVNILQPLREYRVGPGDIVSVYVWDHPELNSPSGILMKSVDSSGFEIDSNGTIFLPYLRPDSGKRPGGLLTVSDSTVETLRSQIRSALDETIKTPQVDVRIAAYRSQRVQVTGEVLTPGIVTLDNTNKGVADAVSERGGLAPGASRRKISLIREGKRYSILTGNQQAAAAFNPALQAGDVIHVPDASDDHVFVLGEIAPNSRTGPLVPMGGGTMSALQAVTSAGGLSQQTADGSGLIVFRQVAKPRVSFGHVDVSLDNQKKGEPQLPDKAEVSTQVFVLDLSTPKGLVIASKFELAPLDVVYVKATGLAQYNAVVAQILPTVQSVYFTTRVVTGQ